MTVKSTKSPEQPEPKQVEKVKAPESDLIWEEIKALPLDIFGLSYQSVQDHVKKIELPGNECYISFKVGSVLPSLEDTLSNMKLTRGKKYLIENADKYYYVKRDNNKTDQVEKAIKAANEQARQEIIKNSVIR